MYISALLSPSIDIAPGGCVSHEHAGSASLPIDVQGILCANFSNATVVLGPLSLLYMLTKAFSLPIASMSSRTALLQAPTMRLASTMAAAMKTCSVRGFPLAYDCGLCVYDGLKMGVEIIRVHSRAIGARNSHRVPMHPRWWCARGATDLLVRSQAGRRPG